MDAQVAAGWDGSKKRAAKGLRRSCWECKKRRTQTSSTAGPVAKADQPCSVHIGERLSKLERLFERFVCRKTSSTADAASDVPRSPTLVGSSNKTDFSLPKIPTDGQSVSSIGDGILGAQTWTSAPTLRPLNKTNGTRKLDPVHQALTALLPSQYDADIIFESSNGWMILGSIYKASHDLYVNGDPQSYALDMEAVARERPIIVARTLLHLAICITSLPPVFKPARLQNIWELDATMNNYIATVTSLITSSDEQMLTLHGLECLLLLAVFHMNSANLRQAWLIVRRAMNLAHLMGFHRIVTQPDCKPAIAVVSSAKAIWRHLVDVDRYLGLHLRLPFAADDVPVADDADVQTVHRARINELSREVAELDRDISPQAYGKALSLDEKLEATMREVPADFWDVPNIPPTARSPESFAALERLMVQMWHFEMKIFIHLPYLLRAAGESRYEYSKVTALQASRNVLMRWFALRNARITQACCRAAEIGVFIAAVTLALDIVIELGMREKCEVQRIKGIDFGMLCRLIGEMESLGQASSREKIAARSAVVLKKLLSSLDPSRPAGGRLTIPYFGVVEVAFQKQPVRPLFDVDSEAGRRAEGTGGHLPVFSFVSNALWPRVEEGYDCELDWDMVLFDGLEDRDTAGNWMF